MVKLARRSASLPHSRREPGTQLTMRTFHIGATVKPGVQAAPNQGKMMVFCIIQDLRAVQRAEGNWVVLK